MIIHGECEVLDGLLVIVVFRNIESGWLVLELVGSVFDVHALLLLRGARHVAHTTELVFLVGALHSLLSGLGLIICTDPGTMVCIYFVHYVFANCF